MKIKFILVTLVLFIFAFQLNVFAGNESASVMSKKCDKAKIEEFCGDALVKIVGPQDWGGIKGFIVTLDTAKMTFKQLTDKMVAAGCN